MKTEKLGGTQEEALYILMGDEVLINGKLSGIVQYIGCLHFADGIWVGVKLDKPGGRHGGSYKEIRYFSVPANCGVFAPPRRLTLIRDGCYYTLSDDKETKQDEGSQSSKNWKAVEPDQ